MKRILSFLLVMSLIGSFFVMPVSAATEQSGIIDGKFRWNIDKDGVFTLKGTGYIDLEFMDDEEANKWYEILYGGILDNVKKVVFAEGIKNIPDGFLADGNYSKIKSVSLPESLEEIGSYCFYSGNYKEITIPKNVSKIGENSFRSTSIENIFVDNSNQFFSAQSGILFNKDKNELIRYPASRKGKSYTISSLVNTVRQGAFAENLNLESLKVPSSVTSVEEQAFERCEKLKTIEFLAKVNLLASRTFAGCEKLKKIEIPNSVLEIANDAFYQCENLTTVKLPDKLQKIGDYAFAGTELQKVQLPKTLTEIGYAAFQNANFKEIEIPAGVKVLDGTFDDCKALKKVTLHEGLQVIGNYTFGGCKKLESINIPSTVTKLGGGAFTYCEKIRSITVPQAVTMIGWDCFSGCTRLTSISLPKKLDVIESSVFADCDSLSSIALPTGVTSIGDYAFENCSDLKKIEIPSTVSNIGYKAFYNTGIKDVHYAGSESEWNSITFESYNTTLKNANVYFGRDTADLATLFSRSAYEYSHTLAKESFNLAVSGFSAVKEYTKTGGDNSPIAKQRYADIKAKYDKMDFEVQNYYNYGTALTDISDKAAYSIATRDIEINGTTKRLIALVVRGGNYGGEWVSNFNVGTNTSYSEGFKKPADSIAKVLKEYINSYSSQEVILWMTSYSRGAAITNLLAGEMDNYADSVNNLKRENIFVYTFATPMPVKISAVDANNEKYNNIYNIISQTDAVPCVLLSQWGFGRYGVTKSFYSNASQGVKEYYKKLTKQDYPISAGQRDTLSEVIYLVNKLVGDKGEFNKKYQGAVQDIIEWCMVYKNVRDTDKTLLDYATDKYSSPKVQEAYKLSASIVQNYKTALVKVGIKENYIDKIKEIGTIFILNDKGLEATVLTSLLDNIIGLQLGPMLLSGLKIYLDFTEGNVTFDGLKASHTPDVYRSWLYSDSDTTKIYIQPYEAPDLSASYGGKYKTQLIHCPVDVTVTDKDGNVVVSVVNHEILIDELPTVVTDDKVKIFYYDNFDEYTTTMTAYDDGVVNYYVSEYAGDGNESRRICYTDIDIKSDESLIGEVNDEIGTDVSNYDLIHGQNSISTTDVIETDNLENLSVTVGVEGSGNVSDITKVSKGDYVTLEAEPYVGAEFIGWYKNEEELSTESTYSFCVEENLNLTAKFTLAVADIFAISAPIEENEAIECDVYVEAIKDVEGELKFIAYSGDEVVDSRSCDVDLTSNKQEKYATTFTKDKNIDRILVCLYDISNVEVTKELTLFVVKGEVPVYEADGFKYTYITEDSVEIVGVNSDASIVIIPETIAENTVVSVAKEAFANSSLKGIILPDTLMAIKENAFSNCNNLSKIFYYGNQEDYEHIIFESGNDFISNALVICEYEGTMIDGEIISIAYSDGNICIDLGIEYCYKDSVATINVYNELSEIVVTEAVSILESEDKKDIIVPLVADDKAYNFEIIFSDAENINMVYDNTLDGAIFAEIIRYSENDFEYIVDAQGNAVITEYLGTDEDVRLPATLNNRNVIGVVNDEFSGNMKTLRMGANIINLENNPFLHCLKLENIIVDNENSRFASIDGVLYDKSKSILMAYPYAKICESFTVPNSVEVIGTYAMAGTKELGQVVLSDTIKSVEEYSFYDSSVCDTIILPKNLTSVGLNAFKGSNVENIVVSDENRVYSSIDGVLFDKTATELMFYPSGRSEDYYLIPEGTKTINSNAFCDGEITYLAIPSSLEKFEELCFNEFWFSFMLYCGDEESWSNITIEGNEDSEYWYVKYNYNSDYRIDAEVKSAVDNGELVSVELNYNYSYQPHNLYAAIYDEGGRLIDLKNDIFYEWDEPGELSFDFEYGENVVPYKVKVFFFESINTIKPLRTVLEAVITRNIE